MPDEPAPYFPVSMNAIHQINLKLYPYAAEKGLAVDETDALFRDMAELYQTTGEVADLPLGE